VVTAFDILLIMVSASILLTGVYRGRSLLRRAPKGDGLADWAALAAAVFLQRKILARPWVGAAHLVLVWGFLLFSLVVIWVQFGPQTGPTTARTLSLLLDFTGVAMLAATVFFLLRRIALLRRPPASPGPRRTIGPLLLLLLILLSGFWAEGARLSLLGEPNAAAPVGWVFAALSPSSALFMQAMLRLHFVAVLAFIALTPFTFMRHLIDAPANLVRGPVQPGLVQAPLSLAQPPFGAHSVLQFDAARLRQSHACVACGRCDEVCPALLAGKPLSPRGIMGAIRDQIDALNRSAAHTEAPQTLMHHGIAAEALWACTTCAACMANCPVQARPADKIVALRQYQVLDGGAAPAAARPMLRNLELYGDVNGKGAAHRGDWALGQEVPVLSAAGAAPEVMLWVGCSGAFHPVYRQTMRAMVKIMRAAGCSFAILAQDEQCCGDPARRLGDEALFLDLAQANIRRFEHYGVTRIVALCPHCFHTLKNEYPALGSTAQVLHAAEYVVQLLRAGRIAPQYAFEGRLAIQDPCYLGRYNGIYQPLRELCAAVPGVRITELSRHAENGFCCGGGGGQMWLHDTGGEKINVLRAREAAAGHVDAVCTACPYCLTMLEDGVKALSLERPPKVVDIIDLVAESIA
jgi:Fe-S oxidoreductase/nitrate reductase gamma subunit